MRIVVAAVGKMRDRHLAAVCDEYLRRARRHLPIDVVEVERDRDLSARLPAGAEVVALEAGGDRLSSAEFASYIGERMLRGTRAVAFLIGGADGLPADVVRRAQRRLSLSTLTFPHRLARVVLCEQLYRALSIIRGEPYDR